MAFSGGHIQPNTNVSPERAPPVSSRCRRHHTQCYGSYRRIYLRPDISEFQWSNGPKRSKVRQKPRRSKPNLSSQANCFQQLLTPDFKTSVWANRFESSYKKIVKLRPQWYLTFLTNNSFHLLDVQIPFLGSLMLNQMGLEMDLDFFVMFSSMAWIVGNIGQFLYSACNAFQDFLAHYRRHVVGLPGLAINRGPISEAGVSEREAGIVKLLTLAGFGFVDALDVIDNVWYTLKHRVWKSLRWLNTVYLRKRRAEKFRWRHCFPACSLARSTRK